MSNANKPEQMTEIGIQNAAAIREMAAMAREADDFFAIQRKVDALGLGEEIELDAPDEIQSMLKGEAAVLKLSAKRWTETESDPDASWTEREVITIRVAGSRLNRGLEREYELEQTPGVAILRIHFV